jgi:DTW domain-containing protein YfiP
MSRRARRGHRCPTCLLHTHLCVCALVPTLPTRTRVVLLLHQLEARKTSNTGRLALRCLPNSEIVMRGRLKDAPVEAPPERWPWDAPDRRALLLFPHEDATPLERWRETDQPLTLVVPDGTWSQAIRMRRRMPGIEALPCVTLGADEVSTYRLRHDPRAGHLSTLEAIARALGKLEDPEITRALLHIHRIAVERTLWTKGQLAAHEVTGGLPPAPAAAEG